uniref:Uncharacterized protein n=1 Tax=Macaca fascicularis TaxID=9541 RepID=A0A7N9C7P1_MACFA
LCKLLELNLISPQVYLICTKVCLVTACCSRRHMHIIEVCYICIHVPCWCAAPINSSFTINKAFTTV